MSRNGNWLLMVIFSVLLILPLTLARAAAEHTVTAGDTLRVTVENHPDFGGTVQVAPNGVIRLPVVNEVSVRGLTLAEVTATLVAAYKQRLLDPRVFVALESRQAAQAFVLGAVKNPGSYDLAAHPGVLELLVAAGLAKPAEDCRATLTRKATGEQVPVTPADVLAGKPRSNLALEDGDLLFVETRRTITVFIAGEVETPGTYDLPEGATVSQALVAAHGLRGDVNGLTLAVQRGTAVLSVDLPAIFRADAGADIAVQAADVLRVAAATLAVTVAGEVQTPAKYTVKVGTDLQGLLTLAGGPTAAAALALVAITHADGVREVVDLPALRQAKAARLLANGDQVFVPSLLKTVTVTGEVKQPGQFKVTAATALADVLALAGGMTPVAMQSAIKLTHVDGSVETLDLAKTPAAPWQEGDHLVVPVAASRITVVGNVPNPGYYPIDPARPYRASEAIMRAGGGNATGKRLEIVRAINGKQTRLKVNLAEALKQPGSAGDLVLQADDVLYVPKPGTSFFSQALSTISSLGVLRVLFGL